MGDNDKALHYYHLGIKELRKVGDRNREALFLGNIANIYTMQKRYTEAAVLYEEVIGIALDTGVQANECIARGNYGSLLIEMNSWELAAEELQKSIAIGTDIYPIAANVFQSMLAYLRSLENNHEQALSLLHDINYPLMKTDVEEYTKLFMYRSNVHHRAETTIRQPKPLKKHVLLLRNINFSDTTDALHQMDETQELLESPTE